MTRYQLLRLIRRLLNRSSIPGWSHDWMPRADGYNRLYVFVSDGKAYYRVEVTIERLA